MAKGFLSIRYKGSALEGLGCGRWYVTVEATSPFPTGADPLRDRARFWCESASRRLRHRSPHFRRLSSVPRISARHRARIVGRGSGDRIRVRDCGRPTGLCHPLSCLRLLRACRRGKTNCCQRIGVLGVHIDGGMADYVCVPEANVAPADGITLDQAAMIEFLAIGAHAVRRASPRKGDRILVVGAGPIGIGCTSVRQARKGLGHSPDIRQYRLDFCQGRLGVDHAVAAGPTAATRCRR